MCISRSERSNDVMMLVCPPGLVGPKLKDMYGHVSFDKVKQCLKTLILSPDDLYNFNSEKNSQVQLNCICEDGENRL